MWCLRWQREQLRSQSHLHSLGSSKLSNGFEEDLRRLHGHVRNTIIVVATCLVLLFAHRAYHGHRGAGYDAICLSTPGSSFAETDTNQNGDLIYGTNFRTSGYGVGTLTRVNGYRVACVVCEADATATFVLHGINCSLNGVRPTG